jgi:hypothetical protein
MAKPNGVPHIMQLAVQDLLGSSIRARALRLGRPLLWLLYLELILNLQDAGGTLPDDPEALADRMPMFLPEEIAELLPLLRPAPGSRGGIVVEGDTCHQPRVTEGLQESQGFHHLASALGKARAATAKRDELGRMVPTKKGSQAAGRKPSQNHAGPTAGVHAGPAVDNLAGEPLIGQTDATKGNQPLDQRGTRPIQPTSTTTITELTTFVPSTDSTNAAAAGNVAREATDVPPPPPQSAPPERPALLDHNPEAAYEVELAEVCRQVVEARGRGDDYAVLREITVTSRGKRMDGVWGAPEAWCRRSVQAGRAILAQLQVPQMGQSAVVADSPQRTPEERRAAVAAGMALIAAAAAGRSPDIVLDGGRALVAGPEVYRPNLGAEGPDVTPQVEEHVDPPEANADAPEKITLERAEDEP